MFKSIAIAAVAAVGVSSASQAGSLTFFESFEVPNLSSGWKVYQNVGDAGNGDWFTVEGGAGIEIQSNNTVRSNGEKVLAQDGDQYVELDSHKGNGGLTGDGISADSTMAHVFDDLTSGDYAVTFYYQPRTGSSSDNSVTAGVYGWDGTDLGSTFEEITVGYQGAPGVTDFYTETRPEWQKFGFNFSLDSTQTVALAFGSVPGSRATYGGFIDSVAVNAVPEPSTWLMMLAGFAVMGASLKRRRAATLA